MELTKQNILLVKNESFPSNTYLLVNELKQCIIIDPGLDFSLIHYGIQKNGLTPLAILSTHGHFDHIGSVDELKIQYKIPFYLHNIDKKLCASLNFYLKIAKINILKKSPVPDFLFQNQRENVFIGGFDIEVYNLPGHTDGSCVFKIGSNLFSGDLVYKKGLGLNNFPGENIAKLKSSILQFSNLFNKNDIIYPGHGASGCLKIFFNENNDLKSFLNSNL